MHKEQIKEFFYIILIVLFFFICAAIFQACSVEPKVEYKEVYVPQKCQVEVPPKLNCSATLPSGDYSEVWKCMVWNHQREEVLESRLRFCIGE